jgi:hypothetical protein
MDTSEMVATFRRGELDFDCQRIAAAETSRYPHRDDWERTVCVPPLVALILMGG